MWQTPNQSKMLPVTCVPPSSEDRHTFAMGGKAGTGIRKDTVNVLPMGSVTVDMEADNPGQWLVHCHNAYHGELGMMTVLSYRT